MLLKISGHQVEGAELISAETEGTITFTGTYEPEHIPQPKPPSGIVPPTLPPSSKPVTTPDENLPQTSFSHDHIWYLIGLVLLIGSIGKFYQLYKADENSDSNNDFYL